MESYHVAQTHPQIIARNNGAGDGAQDGLASRKVGEVLTRAASSDEVVESSLYFMRILNEGMASMVHEKDIRVAEGLRDISLPADPGQASEEWNRRLNDAITGWNRSSGIPLPDQNELLERASYRWSTTASPTSFCFRCTGTRRPIACGRWVPKRPCSRSGA